LGLLVSKITDPSRKVIIAVGSRLLSSKSPKAKTPLRHTRSDVGVGATDSNDPNAHCVRALHTRFDVAVGAAV
jgi:hypothetical protein